MADKAYTPKPPRIPNAGEKIPRQQNSAWDECMDQWQPSDDSKGSVPGVNCPVEEDGKGVPGVYR